MVNFHVTSSPDQLHHVEISSKDEKLLKVFTQSLPGYPQPQLLEGRYVLKMDCSSAQAGELAMQAEDVNQTRGYLETPQKIFPSNHSQQEMILIAQACARIDGKKTLNILYRFGITDQTALKEIFQLCGQETAAFEALLQKHIALPLIRQLPNPQFREALQALHPRHILSSLHSQKEAHHLVDYLQCVDPTGGGRPLLCEALIHHLATLPLDDQHRMVAIEYCLAHNKEATLANLPALGITRLEDAVKIMRTLHGPEVTRENILALANILLKETALHAFKNPPHTRLEAAFSSLSKEDRLFVARHCARGDPHQATALLGKMGLSPQAQLSVKAVCMLKSGNIENATPAEIGALLADAEIGALLAEKSSPPLLEMAKRCLQTASPEEISRLFAAPLTDQDRKKLALHCLDQNRVEDLTTLCITNKKDAQEILLHKNAPQISLGDLHEKTALYLLHQPETTHEQLKAAFRLLDLEMRKTLALEIPPQQLVPYLQDLELSTEDYQTVLVSCMQRDPEGMLPHLYHLGVANREEFKTLVLRCIQETPLDQIETLGPLFHHYQLTPQYRKEIAQAYLEKTRNAPDVWGVIGVLSKKEAEGLVGKKQAELLQVNSLLYCMEHAPQRLRADLDTLSSKEREAVGLLSAKHHPLKTVQNLNQFPFSTEQKVRVLRAALEAAPTKETYQALVKAVQEDVEIGFHEDFENLLSFAAKQNPEECALILDPLHFTGRFVSGYLGARVIEFPLYKELMKRCWERQGLNKADLEKKTKWATLALYLPLFPDDEQMLAKCKKDKTAAAFIKRWR